MYKENFLIKNLINARVLIVATLFSKISSKQINDIYKDNCIPIYIAYK